MFADESGDHGLDGYQDTYPVFALSFVLIHKERYRNQVVPLLQGLKMEVFGHDQVVLHERDIRRQLPPYGFLRTDPVYRTSFLDRINAVVSEAEFELICAIINKDRLKAKYLKPWNPYEIALLFCMESLLVRLRQLDQAGRHVHVVFESRGKPEDDALELEFGRIVRNARQWGHIQVDFSVCEWTPLIVPKSVNSSGLQLADLAARPAGLKALRPTQPNRAWDVLQPKVRHFKAFP